MQKQIKIRCKNSKEKGFVFPSFLEYLSVYQITVRHIRITNRKAQAAAYGQSVYWKVLMKNVFIVKSINFQGTTLPE